MGNVVQGALGSASNLVGGLPIVGGMAKSAIGQGGSMLGMPPQGQQGGQPGGQGGGLMGGKGGGQGGPGQMLGGLMGGGKGGQNPMSQFAQGAARFGNNQNPFGQGNVNRGFSGLPWDQQGGLSGIFGGAPSGMGGQTLAQRRIAARHAQNAAQPGQPPTAQNAQLSGDFQKQYGM